MAHRTKRDTAYAAARAARRYPARWTGVTTLGPAAFALGATLTHNPEAATLALTAGGVATAAGLPWWWTRHVMDKGTADGILRRKSDWAQRVNGTAGRLDVMQYGSATAVSLKGRATRPVTFRGATNWQLRRADSTEFGVQLLELGQGIGWAGEEYWASVEDTTLRIGGPRSYKTLGLICHGLDAKGAVVTTSTRADVAEWLHATRIVRKLADGGTEERAVHFFNPSGYLDIPSTVRWSVLYGCEDFRTAKRRAADLMPEAPDSDAERWDRQARRVLALFLHAAALRPGGRAADVARWAGDSDKDGKSVGEVCEALRLAGPRGTVREREVKAHWATNDKTLTSITNSMMPALSWLSDDRAAELGDADRETVTLNVGRLILESETLHLLGHEEQSGLAPLIACVVAEIAHQARQIAGHSSAGRLDPPLTMLLDEAALVCPVPLDKWMADMGGRGVAIHVAVQSLAQLRQRWGKDGASAILGVVNHLVVHGGNKNADDLQDISTLTGEHRQRVLDPDAEDEKHRWKPVLTAAEISRLGPAEALLLPRVTLCVVGWVPIVLNRKDAVYTELIGKMPEAKPAVAVRLPAIPEQKKTAGETA